MWIIFEYCTIFRVKNKQKILKKKHIQWKCSKKRSVLQTCGHSKDRRTYLSRIWAVEREARAETEPGLCGSFIGAYLLVCYSFCSVTFVDSCPLFCWKATDSLHDYYFIIIPEMKHKTKSNNGIVVKIKKDKCFHKKKKKKCDKLHKMKSVA